LPEFIIIIIPAAVDLGCSTCSIAFPWVYALLL
jgi:hypothetical protein